MIVILKRLNDYFMQLLYQHQDVKDPMLIHLIDFIMEFMFVYILLLMILAFIPMSILFSTFFSYFHSLMSNRVRLNILANNMDDLLLLTHLELSNNFRNSNILLLDRCFHAFIDLSTSVLSNI